MQTWAANETGDGEEVCNDEKIPGLALGNKGLPICMDSPKAEGAVEKIRELRSGSGGHITTKKMKRATLYMATKGAARMLWGFSFCGLGISQQPSLR